MAELTSSVQPRLVIFAPGIHTGGGLTLLKALVQSETLDANTTTLMLDTRALPKLGLPKAADLLEIPPTLTGRLRAEQQVSRLTHRGDTLLCLHSLPPLRRCSAETRCFVQNILHLGGYSLNKYPWKTRLRLTAERLLARLLRHHVDGYIVQSPSMASLLKRWHGGSPQVRIAPFAITPGGGDIPDKPVRSDTEFVYIADGLPHKNHLNLLAAWALLAEQGLHPKLTLTLTERDRELRQRILSETNGQGLNIAIEASLTQQEIFALYRCAKALIYPSYAESLGLPLVEAAALGLPIVAAELDYVRDVCRPAETFDPGSPRSIARAVRRFLAQEEAPQPLLTADQFIDIVLTQGSGETGDDAA